MGVIKLDPTMVRPSFLLPSFLLGEGEQTALALDPREFIPADVNRVSLIVPHPAGVPLVLQPSIGALSGRGVILQDGDPPFEATYDTWGPWLGRAWQVHSIGGDLGMFWYTVSWRGL